MIDQIILENNKKITLEFADITKRNVDAIVNAANSVLNHGGGIARAIVREGGWEIQAESYRIGYCGVGAAVITGAGRLPCKAVIHTVGPQMGEGDEDNKLRNAVRSVLQLAHQRGFNSISIPAISAGIYEFPKDRCAQILVGNTVDYLQAQSTSLNLVEFCIRDNDVLVHLKKEFARYKIVN